MSAPTPFGAALHYGLTQAKPDGAAYLLAREVERLRVIADAAAAYVLVTHRASDELYYTPLLTALRDAVDGYRPGGVS